MLRRVSSGSFEKTERFLRGLDEKKLFANLDRYGREGVDALRSATPVETGRAGKSWGYQIGHTKGHVSISWFNTDVEDGVNIAVILQYGHGTGTGGYVQGIDYINPAMRPVFNRILEDVWRQVTNA
jgi:hypothetical protein